MEPAGSAAPGHSLGFGDRPLPPGRRPEQPAAVSPPTQCGHAWEERACLSGDARSGLWDPRAGRAVRGPPAAPEGPRAPGLRARRGARSSGLAPQWEQRGHGAEGAAGRALWPQADGGRHSPPGTLPGPCCAPASRGAAQGPAGSVPAAPLLVWVTQPGGVPLCARPGLGWGRTSVQGLREAASAIPGRCGERGGGLRSESCRWLCLKD